MVVVISITTMNHTATYQNNSNSKQPDTSAFTHECGEHKEASGKEAFGKEVLDSGESGNGSFGSGLYDHIIYASDVENNGDDGNDCSSTRPNCCAGLMGSRIPARADGADGNDATTHSSPVHHPIRRCDSNSTAVPSFYFRGKWLSNRGRSWYLQ